MHGYSVDLVDVEGWHAIQAALKRGFEAKMKHAQTANRRLKEEVRNTLSSDLLLWHRVTPPPFRLRLRALLLRTDNVARSLLHVCLHDS
jgi:hypothetical protein